MAGSYNRVILVGNLTRDPEQRALQGGKSVTKFSLAVNNPRNKEEVTFVDIVAWDRLGETCNTYLKKGSNCLVEGRLVVRSYDDKDGVKRKAVEVVIDNMQMLGSRPQGMGGDDAHEGGGGYSRPAANAAPANNFAHEDLDDEIPF
ncbi:MAG: single-stranded DNA-binding protein [Candidatus Eremiobacteraeota bacterium]|uniref:Single-stranded DNA-binding protein (SSB) (Helix-destabilizing protein) n=1 Tax=mine drainage metagenome TaxID=410659 RepID=E6PHS8_9ZZZZ|nr:single-stranded DNA-binding protein [Candidatus Eremiobacteraeota bacterium]